ncbi:Cochaperone protein [Chytridiales sp. JEL 0842]|nr:Cochaperone protein [Chytridiales sp. JEL 0842]
MFTEMANGKCSSSESVETRCPTLRPKEYAFSSILSSFVTGSVDEDRDDCGMCMVVDEEDCAGVTGWEGMIEIEDEEAEDDVMMQGETFFSQANAAFVDEDYDLALSLFTQAIQQNPSSADYYLKRATTYAKLHKHKESLDDATAASMLALGNLDVAGRAMLRKGTALFELGDYGGSLKALEEAKKIGCTDKQLETWLTKARAKAPTTATTTTTTTNNNDSKTESANTASAPIPPAASFLPPQKIRHEWFQNENFVTVSVFIKNLPKDAVKIDFHPRSLSVQCKLPTGSDYMLELDPLAHETVPGESKYSVLGTKVEIKLKKAMVGIRWNNLEGEDDGLVQTMTGAAGQQPPSYPSSSKKSKNWDALAKSVEEDKPEGEQALNALFQKIYKDADENTRKAMMKSYVESNGTCLSTNWDEVGKGRVPVTPPDGMVAKKFDI